MQVVSPCIAHLSQLVGTGEAIEDIDDDDHSCMRPTSGNAGCHASDVHPHVAMPLSIDQTCFRADERARCRDAGAVIMTIGQVC
jgi:hypothetical protein